MSSTSTQQSVPWFLKPLVSLTGKVVGVIVNAVAEKAKNDLMSTANLGGQIRALESSIESARDQIKTKDEQLNIIKDEIALIRRGVESLDKKQEDMRREFESTAKGLIEQLMREPSRTEEEKASLRRILDNIQQVEGNVESGREAAKWLIRKREVLIKEISESALADNVDLDVVSDEFRDFRRDVSMYIDWLYFSLRFNQPMPLEDRVGIHSNLPRAAYLEALNLIKIHPSSQGLSNRSLEILKAYIEKLVVALNLD
jgi:uncharacterized phage infection (PIP) family protein YhgE